MSLLIHVMRSLGLVPMMADPFVEEFIVMHCVGLGGKCSVKVRERLLEVVSSLLSSSLCKDSLTADLLKEVSRRSLFFLSVK